MNMKQLGFSRFTSKHPKGFGILEVVVAMGLLGVMTLGVVNVVDLVVKGGKTSDQSLQTAQLVNSLAMVTQNTQSCTTAFAGINLPVTSGQDDTPTSSNSVNMPGITFATLDGTTVNVIQKDPFDYGGLKVQDIFVRNLGALSSFDSSGVVHTRNLVRISLRITRNTGTSIGVPEFTRNIDTGMIVRESDRLFVQCDPTVTGTGGTGGTPSSSDPSQACLAAGGMYDAAAVAPTPNCQWRKLSISSNPGDYNVGAHFPGGANGVYIADTLNTGGAISTSGAITTSAALSANSITSGAITSTGTLSSPTITATDVSTSTLSVLSTMTANTLNATTVNATGTLVAAAISSTGSITANGTITSNATTSPSDLRLKNNIRPIDHALDGVLNLRGVYFNWKDPRSDKDTQVGVIAQEVEKVFPQVVYNHPNGFKSVDYAHLVAVLIEAVKEQQKQINELKKNQKTKD